MASPSTLHTTHAEKRNKKLKSDSYTNSFHARAGLCLTDERGRALTFGVSAYFKRNMALGYMLRVCHVLQARRLREMATWLMRVQTSLPENGRVLIRRYHLAAISRERERQQLERKLLISFSFLLTTAEDIMTILNFNDRNTSV